MGLGAIVGRRWKVITFVLVVAIVWTATRFTGRAAPNVPTAEVTLGEYTDIVEVRGDVRPVKSIIVMAPADAGELTIVTLAKTGTDVKKGDVVAEFDAMTLRRTIMEHQSSLRQADAELNQTRAQARIVAEQHQTSVMKADYDVQRSQLGLREVGLISNVEAERAKLALVDAQQRFSEAEAGAVAARAGSAADERARLRRIDKVKADLERANNAMNALKMIAPADGTVSILPNYRSSTPMGGAQDYRPGDRVPAMSQILELPDLTSVHLTARIEEGDRGYIKPGHTAVIRADAVPDREYHASVTSVSVLARVDFNSGWPPSKMFDLKLTFSDVDNRLRPGMSAVARIAVGRLPDVLRVPADAVFTIDGRTRVFVLRGHEFVPIEIDVLKRGRDVAAIKGSVRAGDKVALVRPDLADAAAAAGGGVK